MVAKADDMAFCDELRTSTRKVHDESDRQVNLKLPLVLTCTKTYGQAIGKFYFVYSAIEESLLRNKGHPHISHILGNVDQERLFRSQHFEKDLQFYLGEDWKSKLEKSSAVTAYCDRILEVSDKNPSLLIAYFHAMYLALLSGGTILKGIIKRTLGLNENEGVSLFHFEGISTSSMKASIKDGINELKLDRKLKDEIIAEKCRVFQMNNTLVQDIDFASASYKRLITFGIIVLATAMLLVYIPMKVFTSSS